MNPETWLLEHTSSQWPAMLLDAVLKCTALLAAACLVAVMLRRRQPALLAWLSQLTLLSVPVVFAAAFFMPDSPWTARLPLSGLTDSESNNGAMRVVNLVPLAAAPSDSSAITPGAPVAAPGLSPAQWAFWLWLASSAGCLMWMCGSALRRRWQRRALAEVYRGPLVDALEKERLACGLRVRPRLFLASAGAMPATWGIVRPAILLPRAASGWSPERLRHVLWHEMAHIRRKDVLLAALAAPARALLWFHPLVRVLCRAVSRYREAACDDAVVAMGRADPAAYAHDLLEIVRAHGVAPSLAATCMAEQGKLSARIHRLLDGAVLRTPLGRCGRNATTMAWAGLTAAAVVLVSCRTVPGSLPSPGDHLNTTVSGKPNPGAGTLNFALIEISYTEGSSSPLQAVLDGNTSGAIAIESMRWLSQQRGVDLIGSGEVKEGQTIEKSSGSFSMRFSGVRARDESRILTDATITLPAEAGGKPDKPLEFSGLRIPDGGFVLLPRTKRRMADKTDQPTPAKFKNNVFVPRQHVRILALSASSSAAPAQSDNGMKILPGDASLPRGDGYLVFQVKFLERPRGKALPAKPGAPFQVPTEKLKEAIGECLNERETVLVTYPRVISKTGVPVKIRNLKFTEQPGKPGTLIPEGTELTLSGNEAARNGLKIELDMKLHSIDSVGNPDQSKLHAVVNMLPGQVPGLVGSLPTYDEKKEVWLLLDAERFINE